LRYIAFVPVRIGSKGIPFKNIKTFCGKPLLYWVLKSLEDTEKVDEIFLAYDDDKILEALNRFEFKKLRYYRRLNENSADTSSTESVLLEFISAKELKGNDRIILAQATSPFTSSQHVSEAIEQLEKSNKQSIVTCVRQKRFIWEDKGEPLNYDFRNRPRRQDFNGYLVENGAFYINSIKNIIKSSCRLTEPVSIYEMPEHTFVEIDEKEDWEIAELIFKNNCLTKSNLLGFPKLFISDVDGVLTDSGMYYSNLGDEIKKFSTYDGMAFELLRKKNVKTAIITGENTTIVENRAKKLKIDFLYQGIKEKLSVVEQLCNKLSISLDEIAYVGDDINDLDVLKEVGFPACPSNAVDKVKNIPKIKILNKRGGEGVVREFVDFLIEKKNKS